MTAHRFSDRVSDFEKSIERKFGIVRLRKIQFTIDETLQVSVVKPRRRLFPQLVQLRRIEHEKKMAKWCYASTLWLPSSKIQWEMLLDLALAGGYQAISGHYYYIDRASGKIRATSDADFHFTISELSVIAEVIEGFEKEFEK